MPFDNLMYILEIKGSMVQHFFDKMAESGGWPVSRTVSFDIAYGKAKNIHINRLPIEAHILYVQWLPFQTMLPMVVIIWIFSKDVSTHIMPVL